MKMGIICVSACLVKTCSLATNADPFANRVSTQIKCCEPRFRNPSGGLHSFPTRNCKTGRPLILPGKSDANCGSKNPAYEIN